MTRHLTRQGRIMLIGCAIVVAGIAMGSVLKLIGVL